MATDRRRELADRLMAGQDAFRRMQQAVARMAMPPEQRNAMTEGLTRLMTPGSQFDAIVELLEAFGPPLAQIQAVQEQLAEQRKQLEAMTHELDRIEVAVGRLAAAAETVAANQGIFVKLAGAITGYDPRRRKTTESSSEQGSQPGTGGAKPDSAGPSGRSGTGFGGTGTGFGSTGQGSGGTGAGAHWGNRDRDTKGGA